MKKGRKKHDITGDVYIGFAYLENQIAGLKHSIIQNGIYYQPELQNEHTIIHIYHVTNMLQSKLVRDRAAQKEKNFICIRYGTDRYSKLEYVEVVYLDEKCVIKSKEELYRAPKTIPIAV